MKNHFNHSKIILSVFREFGISLMGKSKSRKFYSEIDIDRFYFEGILFELETRLGIVLDEKETKNLESPLDVIRCFRSKLEVLEGSKKQLKFRNSEPDYRRVQALVLQ